MRTRLTASFACAYLCLGLAHAQFGRGTPEWGTVGGDAHRASSVPGGPQNFGSQPVEARLRVVLENEVEQRGAGS